MLKHEIVFLIVIAKRKEKLNIINELSTIDAKLFNVIYARGSIKCSELMKTLGLVVEQEKAIITCLMKRENSPKAFEILNNQFDFYKPNTGIAFTIPVDELKY